MKRVARKRVFYILLSIFCLLGAGTVFYAQGWRVDLSTLHISKVGAIYIRTFPKDTALFLDGKPVQKNPGILDSGRLITDLFPKVYTLEARADGLRTWHTKVMVQSSFVNEFKYAVLIPDEAQEVASGSIKSFWLVDSTPIVEVASGTLLFGNTTFPGNTFIGSLNDNNTFITKYANQNRYLVSSTDKGISLKTIETELLVPDPTSNAQVIMKNKRGLYLVDLENMNPPKLLLAVGTSSSVNVVAPSASFIAMSVFDQKTNTSRISLYNKIEATTEQKGVVPGKTISLLWGNNGNTLGILENTGDVLRYETTSDTLAPTASDAKSIAFSSNGAFAVLGHSALELFFPKGATKEYLRFALPNMGYANGIMWYADNIHLFVNYPDRVMFLDSEDTGLTHYETITETTLSQYNADSNTLFFIKTGSLFSLIFPK